MNNSNANNQKARVSTLNDEKKQEQLQEYLNSIQNSKKTTNNNSSSNNSNINLNNYNLNMIISEDSIEHQSDSQDQEKLFDFFNTDNKRKNKINKFGNKKHFTRYVLAQSLSKIQQLKPQPSLQTAQQQQQDQQLFTSMSCQPQEFERDPVHKDTLFKSTSAVNQQIPKSSNALSTNSNQKNGSLLAPSSHNSYQLKLQHCNKSTQEPQTKYQQDSQESQDQEQKNSNIFNTLRSPFRQKFIEYNFGPRYNKDNSLVPYSIVGKQSWFQRQQQMLNKNGKKAKIQNFRKKNQDEDELIEDDDEDLDQFNSSESNFKEQPVIQEDASPSRRIVETKGFSSGIRKMQKGKKKTKQLLSLKKKISGNEENDGYSNRSKSVIHSQSHLGQSAAQLKQSMQHNKFMNKGKKQNMKFQCVTKQDLILKLQEQAQKVDQINNEEQNCFQKMSLQAKNIITREKRVIQRHEDQEFLWQKQLQNLSEKNHRSVNDLLMLKSDDFRAKVEQVDALEMIKPPAERFGTKIWYLNLRHYDRDIQKQNPNKIQLDERIYPDIHSGFSSLISYQPKQEIEIIRKPLSKVSHSRFYSTFSTNFNNTKKMSSTGYSKISNQTQHSTSLTTQKIIQHRKHAEKGLVFDCDTDDLVVNGESKLKVELDNLMNDGNDMGCTYKRFKPLEEEIKDKKIEKIKHEIKINGGKVKPSDLQNPKFKNKLDYISPETQNEIYQQNEDIYTQSMTGKHSINKFYKNIDKLNDQRKQKDKEEFKQQILQSTEPDRL